MDGLTILAMILGRIRPNFKVDMYSKITKVKKLTIAQYDNDVQLFFDAIKYYKLHIDQKNLLHTLRMHSFKTSFSN